MSNSGPGLPPADDVPTDAGDGPDPTVFPTYYDRHAGLRPFAEHWASKRATYDRFLKAWERAQRCVSGRNADWRLPDDLAAEWQARWADDVFRGVIPAHDRLSARQVRESVRDLRAVVEAALFVGRLTGLDSARRVELTEYPSEMAPGRGLIPRIRLSDRRSLGPGCDREAGFPAYDLETFLERARFLLAAPTADDWSWLRRLGCELEEPVSNPPLRYRQWVGDRFREAIPRLSWRLEVAPAEIADPALPFEVVFERSQSWYAAASSALTRSAERPPPTSARTSGRQPGEGGEPSAEPNAVPAHPPASPPLKLPDPKPDGTNPFLVIDWVLYTHYVAAMHLTQARKERVAELGRQLRTEEVSGVLKLHWEDDVDRQSVNKRLNGYLIQWWGALWEARNLAAEFRIPFAEYDPVLRAAKARLNDLDGIIQGITSGNEVYPFDHVNHRLHDLAASTSPKPPAAVRPPAVPHDESGGPGANIVGESGHPKNAAPPPPTPGPENGGGARPEAARPARDPNKPGQDRQNDILAVIANAGTPLTRPELVGALKLKAEGKLGHHLAWMVARDILINVPQRGYWPADRPVPS